MAQSLNAILEGEVMDALEVANGVVSSALRAYRSRHYMCQLYMKVGTIG
ncbi:MAG: hypothetical protein OXG15_13075 [Gammaproteobacteria bacterium]|nr:hypothetical protein [Gammaproteobacteria bacterium]